MPIPRPRPKSSHGLCAKSATGDEIELGYVSGLFGVRGEVRLFLHNRETSAFDTARNVQLVLPDGSRHTARLAVRSGAGNRILGRISGVTDRDQAAALQGARLVVRRQSLPPLEDGEFWLCDVVNRPVVVNGHEVGRVLAVHQNGPVDVFEIRVAGEVHWVPALTEWVVAVGDHLELVSDALV
jgi:16S rRNA processing protein RimM